MTAAKKAKKHDAGKDRWDLLPWDAAREIVRVLTFGAQKYGPGQWRDVPDAERRYTAAMLRHVSAWCMGERLDEESGLHHLAHAGCCILFLLSADRGVADE